jgi:hypothetical protein
MDIYYYRVFCYYTYKSSKNHYLYNLKIIFSPNLMINILYRDNETLLKIDS